MIRLIASDMDGTLLDATHTISEDNKQAIFSAQQQGVEFIVATGRAYAEATMPLIESGIQCAAICLNGAMIYDDKGNILRTVAFTQAQLDVLFDILETNQVFFQVYTNKRIYTLNIEQDIQNYCRMIASNGHEPNYDKIRRRIYERVAQGSMQEMAQYAQLRERDDEIILKLLCMIDDQQQYQYIKDKLNKEVKDIAVSSSGYTNIEITHLDAQKGNALKFYSQLKAINLNDTMAIGDNLNDLSMLQVAGHAYAVANGASQLKEIADFIAPNNIDSGVAYAINKVLKENDKIH